MTRKSRNRTGRAFRIPHNDSPETYAYCHEANPAAGNCAYGIVGDRTTCGGVGCSRSFVVDVGVHCRRSCVVGRAGDPVPVDLEVAPWVCVATPWGRRPGIDRRRTWSRLGIN